MLEHLLTQLSEALHFPLLLEQEREKKSYTLTVNETTDLVFKELELGFSCKSWIAPVPKKERLEELYILCMRANFLGQGTKGAVIALDESLKHFLFTLSITEEMNYRLFKDTVEDFVNYLNYWKERISSHNP